LIDKETRVEIEEFLQMSDQYLKEISAEDEELRKLKIKKEADLEKQKALKNASRDHVIIRMNKIINKPSESNVHQRGVLDLSNTKSIYEGIKQIVELGMKKKNLEKIEVEIEEKEEVEEKESEGKEDLDDSGSNQDSTNNEDPGSIFGISSYKNYLEWYHLKKLKVDDFALPEEIHNQIDPKSLFNEKTRA
jgi:hypothetical protein